MKLVDLFLKTAGKNEKKVFSIVLLIMIFFHMLRVGPRVRVAASWFKDNFVPDPYGRLPVKGKIIFNKLDIVFSMISLITPILLFSLLSFALLYADVVEYSLKQWGVFFCVGGVSYLLTGALIKNAFKAWDKNVELKQFVSH